MHTHDRQFFGSPCFSSSSSHGRLHVLHGLLLYHLRFVRLLQDASNTLLRLQVPTDATIRARHFSQRQLLILVLLTCAFGKAGTGNLVEQIRVHFHLSSCWKLDAKKWRLGRARDVSVRVPVVDGISFTRNSPVAQQSTREDDGLQPYYYCMWFLCQEEQTYPQTTDQGPEAPVALLQRSCSSWIGGTIKHFVCVEMCCIWSSASRAMARVSGLGSRVATMMRATYRQFTGTQYVDYQVQVPLYQVLVPYRPPIWRWGRGKNMHESVSTKFHFY